MDQKHPGSIHCSMDALVWGMWRKWSEERSCACLQLSSYQDSGISSISTTFCGQFSNFLIMRSWPSQRGDIVLDMPKRQRGTWQPSNWLGVLAMVTCLWLPNMIKCCRNLSCRFPSFLYRSWAFNWWMAAELHTDYTDQLDQRIEDHSAGKDFFCRDSQCDIFLPACVIGRKVCLHNLRISAETLPSGLVAPGHCSWTHRMLQNCGILLGSVWKLSPSQSCAHQLLLEMISNDFVTFTHNFCQFLI